jgi:hypothetical protein
MKHFSQRAHIAASTLCKMLIVMCIAGVAGCGNSDVSKVKAMKLDIDPSYTIGQAFDNRKVCDSVKWDTVTDTRGRKLVEYRCLWKGVKEGMAPAASPVVSAGEVFQWSIADDGTPTLAYVGSETTHENGQVDDQALNLDAAMQVIVKDTATTLTEYNEQYLVAQYKARMQ